MALDPATVVPARSAIVVNECQEGVVGAATFLPQLREVALEALGNIDRICRAARAAGAQVVHCVVRPRPDGKGETPHTLFAAMDRRRRADPDAATIDPDTFSAVVPEISVEPDDIVIRRVHAMSPMADTGLDSQLRNLGITTVVAAGVSLNLGVTSLVLDAMNRGYQVVLPVDAAAGVPQDYCRELVRHTLGMVSRVTTTDELLDTWARGTEARDTAEQSWRKP